MVRESETRFSSGQQTILQVLDPIHRSLLINNSEFESINETNQQKPSTIVADEVFKRQSQQQQPTPTVQHQEKQHRKNSIENKHFYDAGSFEKPDATCVSDSNCLMLFHKEFNQPNELECTSPVNDTKQNLNDSQLRKNIKIRIVTNKKRRSLEEHPTERMSLESQTDSSAYDYVDTDSEVESSSDAPDENLVTNSGTSTNTDEFSDYNDFNNFESSSNTSSTATSDSNAHMIQIVQEITEQRTVVSTVHVNKKKVKSFQRTKAEKRVSVSPKGKPKWKNKQKIIDDNVCNEILDETIKWNVNEGDEQNNAIESPSPVDTILFGELKAKPKRSQRKMGKLMERRLSRVLSNDVPSPNHHASDSIQPVPKPSVAPAKPPRTFTSSTSSSKASSDSIGANTATTLAIEDFHRSLTSHHSSQMSPGGGWIFDKTMKPTCPTLDDIINDAEHSKKIGWVSSIPERNEFVQVFNMLNDCHPMRSSKITSANLTPEPQFRTLQYKEDIDQVDSSVPPKPALRRSKQIMSTELNDSICSSTPVKRTHLNFSSHSVPNAGRCEMEICKKCKLQIMEPSSVRKSFGKGAIKRTKLFFKASKNIWNKPKPVKSMKQPYGSCSDDSECYVDLDNNVEETPTKLKLNTTAEFNTNDTPLVKKKTEKSLDLTPKQLENANSNEGPRRILDKLLTSVKRTPPKKPIRQSLIHKDVTRSPSNNEENNFNFDRVVDSPKSKEKSFKLSPRKLFFSSHERSQVQPNSYRSYEADQSDDLKQCIVEYLRNMNEQIERKHGEVDSATVPRRRSRIRNFSTSSDAIDYIPQRQRVVQIDCHPEPVYSEISVQPTRSSLNHIIVNDNPKAIYTTVNKTKNRKSVTLNPPDVNEIYVGNEDAAYRSWNSLDKLSINNNLADSVLNMLALMEQQNLDKDTQIADTIDNIKPQDNGTKVQNSIIVEPPTVQLTSERFQQSAFKGNDDKTCDDNSSMETFFTESMCDDVNRGDSVNNNIVSTFDQVENLVSAIKLVEPETDSDSSEHFHRSDHIHRTADVEPVSNEDSVDYCRIVKENVAKRPTSGQSSATRRNHNLQSPLVAAPSMIEIPDQLMLKLSNQITAQREIRNQLKHAIQICRTTREFECSSELIEAERLLLLSAKKEARAKLELTRIDYEENGLTASPAKCVGTLTIKKIEFDLKAEEMLEEIFQLSYICICSYRDQVVATHPQERSGNKVTFNDIGMKIGSLNSMFEIKLEIYVLRLPRPLRKYSHESKYHLNKIPKRPLFPNPVKLFSNSTSKLTPDIEESRFRLRGSATISPNSLSSEKFEIVRNTSWPKDHVYISYNTKSLNLKINDQFTNMTGAFRTEFVCEIKLSDSGLTGFLSIAEVNGVMQEMWCRLIGCTMEFWNDDIDCLNGKAPTLSIDLVKCTNELFELVDDKFAVNIFNEDIVGLGDKNRINHHWISAHNRKDLILWLTDLNRILKFIKDWNI